MRNDLLRIITNLKDVTGLCVSIVSKDGSVDISTFKEYFPISREHFNSNDDYILDNNEEITLFKFTFGTQKFLCAVKGIDKTALTYASLIKCYIESNQAKSVDLTYNEEYLSIVTGDSTKSKTAHFISKHSISKSRCIAMIIKSEKEKASEICEFLKDYSSNNSDNALVLDKNACIYIKFLDKELSEEYLSPQEYARSMIRSLYEELGINACAYLGGVVTSFQDVSLSYSQAVIAERMNVAYGVKTAVSAYKDFIIVKIAEDIPKSKAEEYLNAILSPEAKEIIEDTELLKTGEEFLRNNLNVSETARILHVHRNTLMYRLNKIEKISGLDLRKFNDSLDFKIISVLKRLID